MLAVKLVSKCTCSCTSWCGWFGHPSFDNRFAPCDTKRCATTSRKTAKKAKKIYCNE